jgi:alpha-mannosidase
MNNYWETNYKADQQGATTFRYSIQPHAGVYDQTRATQFGVERSQPLIAVPADNSGLPGLATILRLDTPGVQISSIKPSRDGNAQIVRLFAASGKPERTSLNFPDAARRTVYVSSQGEERGPLADGTIELPAYGIVTLRIER